CVFLLTSSLFLVYAVLTREPGVAAANREPVQFGNALRESARALVPVSPYIVITVGVVYIYKYFLDTKLDEFTAPVMLPIIMLFIVIFDKIRR
ncbi:hypothetical protein ABTJ09_20525, partial [Acinetobacter baumannii]